MNRHYDEETGDETISFENGTSVTIDESGNRDYWDKYNQPTDYNYKDFGDPVEWDSSNLKCPEDTWEHEAAQEAELDTSDWDLDD